ncbi:MAG: hypothetical protein V1857_07340, partial [archaeon]
DNNPGRDNWSPYLGVPQSLLVGVVIGTIPYVGYIILALKEPLGMMFVATLTVVVIVYEFILPLTKKTKGSQAVSSTKREDDDALQPAS